MTLIEKECERCGSVFTFEHKRGRPRVLCDACGNKHAPRNYDPSGDFHIKLNKKDREKLQLIMDELGVGRIESIRTTIRIYHALLTRDMLRGR